MLFPIYDCSHVVFKLPCQLIDFQSSLKVVVWKHDAVVFVLHFCVFHGKLNIMELKNRTIFGRA